MAINHSLKDDLTDEGIETLISKLQFRPSRTLKDDLTDEGIGRRFQRQGLVISELKGLGGAFSA